MYLIGGGSLAQDFVMSSPKLSNYIRSHRKCYGLSQNDVAFLLSSSNGAKVSRYEHFRQQPNLETAIALEILFRTPVRTLFGDVSEKVERRVIRQVGILARKLERSAQNRATIRKMEMLETLCCELRQIQGQIT